MQQLVDTPDIQIYLDQVPGDWPPDAFLLTEQEMAYCLQSDKRELQLSRAKLRMMAKEILRDHQVEVVTGDLGRPQVLPEWDISFSHKGTKALVGLTRSPDRLGVDLECLQQKVDWSAFAGRCFLNDEGEELVKLAHLPGWNLHQAHLAFYSVKEAFFKAMNSHFTPADLRLKLAEERMGVFHFEAFYKGRKQNDMTCYIIKTSEEVISVCHIRACL